MSILNMLFGARTKSASVAKERLQIILARERNQNNTHTDYLPDLQRELIEVISKYIHIDPQDIKVSLERQDNYEVLEVNIVLPEQARAAATEMPI